MQVASVKYNYIPFIAAMVGVSWAVRLEIFKKLTGALVAQSSFPSTAHPFPFHLPFLPVSFHFSRRLRLT